MKKLISYLLLTCLLISPAWSADEWLKTRPALTGDQWTAWPAASQANNAALDRVLANYRQGMTLSYSSATTVAVSSGEVVCSNSDGSARKMRQNPSATNVTFTDIDTGAEASSTTYYIYANCDADATTATFKVSASSTAPTGVTYFKRLGSFYNDSSSNIEQYSITNDNAVNTSKIYDSGWFAVTYRNSYTKTHNLGSNKVLITTFFSTDSGGANAFVADVQNDMSSYYGIIVKNITTTTADVIFMYNGIRTPATDGSEPISTSGYARTIIQRLD